MTAATDNRLSVAPYHEALDGVKTQFALIRFAFSRLPKSRIQEFFKSRLTDQLSAIDANTRGMAANLPGDQKAKIENAIPSVLKFWEKQERKKNRPADIRFKRELSEDRLNQSELLLLVAHFESFMKEVHRTFLTAAPARVFGESDTKVMLRDVFDVQAANPFEKFLKEQIIKEVKRVDAQRIEQRAEYFERCFGVAFGSKAEIDHLKEIMKTRNKIAHEIYSRPPCTLEQVTEQPLASDEVLGRARSLFHDVPWRCIRAGEKDYPAYFH